MSEDLFAAFGVNNGSVPSLAPAQAGPSADEISARQSTIGTVHGKQSIEDDDDFGDFEDAEAESINANPASIISQNQTTVLAQSVDSTLPVRMKSTNHTARPQPTSTNLPFKPRPEGTVTDSRIGRHPFADHMDMLFEAGEEEYDAGRDELNLSNDPEAAMAYSKRVIEEQIKAEASRSSATAPVPQQSGTAATTDTGKPPPKNRDPDVLFDAEDLSEVESAPEDDDWGDFEETTSSTNMQTQTAAQTALPSIDLLGLDDMPQPVDNKAAQNDSAAQMLDNAFSPVQASRPSFTRVESEESWDDFDDATPKSKTGSTQPSINLPTSTPTTVPPPSVLLSVLAANLKATPDTSNQEDLLNNAVVLAHVLAGRKLRWKRSTSLAASMRIGPAGAGKSGMKLAGVDRAEISREDREVAEALGVWKRQVGKLRAAVSSSKHKAMRVPDLQETLPVKTLKAVDGGFTAPHECALCGLRREERIAKVDDEVQDSFGEWWIDNANMHVICGTWWSQNELAMRSR